jgi:hypothetical protein
MASRKLFSTFWKQMPFWLNDLQATEHRVLALLANQPSAQNSVRCKTRIKTIRARGQSCPARVMEHLAKDPSEERRQASGGSKGRR